MRRALFGDDAAGDAPAVSIPKGVARLVEHVVCHSDPERYALLYRLVWRVLNGERDLLEVASDPLVHRHRSHGALRAARPAQDARLRALPPHAP